jgi:hypothetical protein
MFSLCIWSKGTRWVAYKAPSPEDLLPWLFLSRDLELKKRFRMYQALSDVRQLCHLQRMRPGRGSSPDCLQIPSEPSSCCPAPLLPTKHLRLTCSTTCPPPLLPMFFVSAFPAFLCQLSLQCGPGPVLAVYPMHW